MELDLNTVGQFSEALGQSSRSIGAAVDVAAKLNKLVTSGKSSDSPEARELVVALVEQLADAKLANAELKESIAELKVALLELKEAEEKFKDYELHKLSNGEWVYKSGDHEREHMICPTCKEAEKKILLAPDGKGFWCHICQRHFGPSEYSHSF